MTETTTRERWFGKYLVDVPPGRSGDVEVRPLTVSNMEAAIGAMRGHGIVAGEYTALYRNGGLWMSDTPDEISDQMAAVREAQRRGGRVLVNGLGLGMFVKAVLAFDNVTRVDVVEIDEDVVNLVAPTYMADERLHVYLHDAFTQEWPRGTRWSVAWHDIWQDLSGDERPEMTRLRRKYGNRVDWQDCWGRRIYGRAGLRW